MKSLTLTAEQKNKLLEMVKSLFPEYKEINLVSKDQEGNYEEEDFLYLGENLIHWFEFCYNHLFTKIFVENNGYESISDYIAMNSRFITGHPVDYLYKEFLMLKNYG